MKNTNLLSKIAFVLTLVFWGISIIGFLYASFFVSSKLATDTSIMAPKTLTQLFFISVTFLAAPFLEILSIAAYLKNEKNWKTITALALNALPIILIIILCLKQGGNIFVSYNEIFRLVFSPFL